jgi:O-antigen/teichoic acid export membrane protein
VPPIERDERRAFSTFGAQCGDALSIRRRFLGGSIANLFAMAFNQGSTLVIGIVVARLLRLDAYGQYATIYTTLLAAGTLAQVAVGNTAGKFIAEHRANDPTRAGRIIGLLGIASIVVAGLGAATVALVSPWLSEIVLREPGLTSGLRIGAVFLFFFALNGYQLGVLWGLEAFSGLARAGVASGVAAILAVSAGAWLGGRDGAIAGLCAASVVRWVFHSFVIRAETLRRAIPVRFAYRAGQDRSLLSRFAIPAALSGWFAWSMLWISTSVLVRQPGGFKEMGVYSAANSIRLLVLFLPSVVNNVGFSILNFESSRRNGDHRQAFRLNLVASSLISALGVVAVGLVGRPVLALFGKDFRVGYALLWMLLASTIFDGVSMALFQYVQMKARIWMSLFWIIVPRDTFLVIAAIFLVPGRLGVGLAEAYLAASILGFLLHLSLFGFLIRKNSRGNEGPMAHAVAGE